MFFSGACKKSKNAWSHFFSPQKTKSRGTSGAGGRHFTYETTPAKSAPIARLELDSKRDRSRSHGTHSEAELLLLPREASCGRLPERDALTLHGAGSQKTKKQRTNGGATEMRPHRELVHF